ncbi:MAG: 23S rRNA (cytidine2498-2'-O)-methyltransferase [Pseudomonadales bacterium]|jgi:23S rRNA (cytidine2498-2'-O)-methyltransferase
MSLQTYPQSNYVNSSKSSNASEAEVKTMLFYCREGYESDLAAELEHHSATQQLYGYSQLVPNSAIVKYHFYKGLTKQQQTKSFPWQDLIFARQRLCVLGDLEFTDTQDRIGSIIEYMSQFTDIEENGLGDVFVEHADNEKGKEVAKFCKKFTVPLRQALRKKGWLTKKSHTGLPYLHLFLSDSSACVIAMSHPKNRHAQPLGITRLKFPPEAPSRSTLKLDEAIQLFMSPVQQSNYLQKGMTAVDLGACPGGWTFQLVSRGMRVEAIDNGAMDEGLMATGLVKYQATDGFKYQPIDGHVDWLVCDMIEKPEKVSILITQWLTKRQATSSIFNLKLPMKQRFQTVNELLAEMSSKLTEHQILHQMQAKHLYHDRDEITVIVRSGVHLI